MKNFCSIIILNFNGKQYLHDCLTSVLAQSDSNYEIILVDNGSTDGSIDDVTRFFPTVKIISSEKNLGFAAGNNLGVRNAHGEIIVLLNNDTTVDHGWLRALIDALKPDDVAIASSHVVTQGISDSDYEYNGSANLVAHNIMRVFQKRENTLYPNGASLAYKKKILGEPFDDDYFAYSEDLYLGLRARFKGYKVVHVSDSLVMHYGGATTKKIKQEKILFLQERNRLLTILLFFSFSTRVKLIPYFILNLIGKMIISFMHSKYKTRALVKAYWWLIKNNSLIRQKRNKLRSDIRCSDANVLSWMTARLTNGKTSTQKFLNFISLLYCKIVVLHTIEFYKQEMR